MSVDVISTKNMTYSYNGVEAISDISFAVKKGDYVGIVGPNGSGKSTLVKNILGILPPQKGLVYLFGQPFSAFRQWNKIGYLPQKLSSLNTHFPGTVYEIAGLGLWGQNSENLEMTLKLMGVGHLSSRLIGELSYGEQQRVMLARALVGQPELLILDEPTTALDPETRDIFYSLTEELNRLTGTTIVLVTHDIGVIGKYARQLLYLDKKAVFAGTFGDFCNSPTMTGLFGPMSQHIICHQHDQTRE